MHAQAVTDPDGLAGLVLVAPAIFAFPGPEFADVQLTPHRPGGGAGAGVVEATPAEERRAAAAQAAAHLGFEPSGCHVTDPPEVRRLYPRREEPEPGAGAGAGQRQQQQPQPLERSGSGSGLSRSGGGRRARRGRLLRALGRLAGGLASLLALGVLRLLAPVITLLLRSLVRRRTFWLKVSSNIHEEGDRVGGVLVECECARVSAGRPEPCPWHPMQAPHVLLLLSPPAHHNSTGPAAGLLQPFWRHARHRGQLPHAAVGARLGGGHGQLPAGETHAAQVCVGVSVCVRPGRALVLL